MEEIEDSILISDVKKSKSDNGRIYPWFPDWNNEFEQIKLLKERSIKIKTILNKTK
tara:strand:- start:952 stop:1119 length:168 start_codon:yes stop_codon:yes gene_type:complete